MARYGERSSIPVVAGIYLLIGLAFRLGQSLYARSGGPAYSGADPLGVFGAPGPLSEKIGLIITWWVIPALVWPFGVLSMIWGALSNR